MENIFNYYFSYAILFIIISLVLSIITFLLIKKNRYRLLCGMATIATVFSYFISLSIIVIQINNQLLTYIYLAVLVLIFIPIFLLTFLSAFLFIWNGIIVWRRENHSIGNMLTLIIGVLLLIIPTVFSILNRYIPNNKIIDFVENVSYGFQNYSIFWVLTFLASYMITKVVHPKFNKEYAIILGSGLLNGDTVSPLLGSRIMVAANFKNQQFKKNKKTMKLIMSGGQGKDELLPEAEAMKAYAIMHGVAESDILVENQSKNTYQNMLFSKQVVEKNGFNLQKGIFATNDYHVFRAAGFAHLVGLNIEGIGSKTSKYFLPNALIREYIAILSNHKTFHIAFMLIIVIINALTFFIV
ncbi:YdcF family protein [Leuconostoc kimchii]|uniref:YdcF family protein n=1 Tax=Leuconostoc kimchii TaxID=136609 RepID=A0ABX5SJN2_9LACO|nr:YdcF family protein [Leuconostoc kimchii]QBR47551.1 YdcF family protein [Leuconostoc kimchii]